MNPSEVIKLFSDDKLKSIEPYGCGHINSTFVAEFENEKGESYQLLLQKINNYVFPDVEGLMNNIIGVTEYLRKHLSEGEDPKRAVMTVYPSLSGALYEKVGEEYYRCYTFISDTVTYQAIENPQDFYNCAAAFGDFQRRLADYPAESLCETIVNFHNTESRFNNLLAAIEANKAGRKDEVQAEIDFALSHKNLALEIVNRLKENKIPLRVTHNDTKLNNILFDAASGKALCIVDLDTVMPGAVCYDFGDSIRFGASSAAEDEKDLEKVYMDISLFEEYTKGYLSVAKEFLTEEELETLSIGSAVMTLECGMRFLTDYLDGDVYFATHYEGQNLDRCRTQFKLVADMEAKMNEMQAIVKKYAR